MCRSSQASKAPPWAGSGDWVTPKTLALSAVIDEPAIMSEQKHEVLVHVRNFLLDAFDDRDLGSPEYFLGTTSEHNRSDSKPWYRPGRA